MYAELLITLVINSNSQLIRQAATAAFETILLVVKARPLFCCVVVKTAQLRKKHKQLATLVGPHHIFNQSLFTKCFENVGIYR